MNVNRNAFPVIIGLLALLPWVFLFFLFLQGNQQFSPSQQASLPPPGEKVREEPRDDSAAPSTVHNLRRQIERLNDEINYLEEENENLRTRIRSGEGTAGEDRVKELQDELDKERQARREAMADLESLRKTYNETLREMVRMRTEQMDPPSPPVEEPAPEPNTPPVVPQEEIPVEPEPAPPSRRPRDTGGGWIMPPG